MPRHELILGGARSGKSRFAERRAESTGLNVTYIATCQPWDEELQQRIHQHQRRRPKHWGLIEEPFALAQALSQQSAADRCLLVDCLTLWLTNLLMLEQPERLTQERQALLETLPHLPGPVLLVSNETGLGVTPLGVLTRRYVDEAGALHQALAECCSQVTMVVAGLPLTLKEPSNA